MTSRFLMRMTIFGPRGTNLLGLALLPIVILVMVFPACGGQRGLSAEILITRLEQVTTATCACKDKACAQQNLKQLEQLGTAKRGNEFTPKQRKLMAELGSKLGPCLVKRGITVEEIQRAAAKMN